jgi:hypothetical protein
LGSELLLPLLLLLHLLLLPLLLRPLLLLPLLLRRRLRNPAPLRYRRWFPALLMLSLLLRRRLCNPTALRYRRRFPALLMLLRLWHAGALLQEGLGAWLLQLALVLRCRRVLELPPWCEGAVDASTVLIDRQGGEVGQDLPGSLLLWGRRLPVLVLPLSWRVLALLTGLWYPCGFGLLWNLLCAPLLLLWLRGNNAGIRTGEGRSRDLGR